MATVFLPPAAVPAATSQQFLRRKPNCSNSIKCCDKSAGEAIDLSNNNGRKPTHSEKTHHHAHQQDSISGVPPPPRPRRIILVRHGQSEGNIDESAYTRIADPKIALTEKGKAESEERGRRIREMIEKDGVDDWQVYFYVSPYRRTLETLQHLGRAFERSRIAGMTKEPRLREQDFGN